MPFGRRFKDKYAGSYPERICCPNSARLVVSVDSALEYQFHKLQGTKGHLNSYQITTTVSDFSFILFISGFPQWSSLRRCRINSERVGHDLPFPRTTILAIFVQGWKVFRGKFFLITVKLRNNGSEGTGCIIPLLPKSGIAKMSFVIDRETVFCH